MGNHKRDGKPHGSEFTKDMLPHNRREVFSDVLKNHWRTLTVIGALVLLFSSPLFVSRLLQDIISAKLSAALPADATGEQLAATAADILRIENIRAFLNAACLMLFSLGFSGLVRIVRGYAWGDIVRFGEDFRKGFKQNALQMLLLFSISGLLYASCVLLVNMSAADNGVIGYLAFVPVCIAGIVFLPVAGYIAVAIAIYSHSFLENAKLAFFVYLRSPFKTLLATLCSAAIYAVQFIPNRYCHMYGWLFAGFLTPLVMLGWTLFCYNQFDKYINGTNYPNLIGRGTTKCQYDFNGEREEIADPTEPTAPTEPPPEDHT